MTNGGWDMSKIDSFDKNLGKYSKSEVVNETGDVTIASITKDASNHDTIQIYAVGDLHYGSRGSLRKELLENLEYANRQDNAYVFFLGDMMNTAIVGSKSDPYEDDKNPQEQLDFFSEILAYAKGDQRIIDLLTNLNKSNKILNSSGKVVVVHSGNHEDRVTRTVGISSTKAAADIAGVGNSYAPFFALSTILLRQPLAEGGVFPVTFFTHHGTGISNSDQMFKLMRNVCNADYYMAGHTHKPSLGFKRNICTEANGKQYYHKATYIVVPAGGGGTYAAGKAMADVPKQAGVWFTISTQPNPDVNRISPTGIKYRPIEPALAGFNEKVEPTTQIQQKRTKQAKQTISGCKVGDKHIYKEIDKLLTGIANAQESTINKIKRRIVEKPLPEPEGFEEFLAQKYGPKQTVFMIKDDNKPSVATDTGNPSMGEDK